MKVIDNINSNHSLSIHKMSVSADQMILVSPFLTEDFSEFVHAISKTSVNKISLITTLKDHSPELYKKAGSLNTFCSACTLNNIHFEVRIDNQLHGKLYIAMKNNLPILGIITSANFTTSGLTRNHEWGVEIDDSEKLSAIVSDLYKCCSSPLSNYEITNIVQSIDEYFNKNNPLPEPKIALKVNHLIKTSIVSTGIELGKRYFIKPIGASDQHFTPDRVLNPDIQEMQFSRRRPAAVRTGDILICYGVGPAKLLGYFEVLTEPVLVNDDTDRWPWKIETKNLCPSYSDNWVNFNNTIASIQASYNHATPLTYVSGDSLGALQFGADRILLNPYFAKHIIDIIENSVK